MKKTITNYTFDASAKTITFNDYASISLERIVSVINLNNSTNLALIMFQANTNDFNYRKATVATNVLTVTCDTSQMSDSDKLQIVYDDDNVLPAKYTTLLDSTSTAGYVYVGEVAPGTAQSASAWRIQKINSTTGDTTWADGVATFIKVWNSRTSYTYS